MGTATWLAPTLALVGSVAVAAVGYYQWRRTDKRRGAADFDKKRAAVLRILVEQLQGLQLLSRNRAGQSTNLASQAKGLNEFLIENRLWIQPDEAQLARQYLEALIEISFAMESTTSEDLDVFIGTGAGPYSDSVANEFRRLARAEEELIDAVRATLKNA